MTRRFRHGSLSNGLILLMTGICLTVGASPVMAYVPSGPHVLELMVQALDKAQALRISQTVAMEDGSLQSTFLKETLSYIFPGRVRSEIQNENIHRIQVVAYDHSLTIVNGKRTRDSVTRADRYKLLLSHRSRMLLHKMLLTFGVDVEKTSLGRFEDKIVWVIGAQYPDESVSQVWVDKESFLPLRWVDISSAGLGDRLEFIYRRWQKKGDVWYPLAVEVYLNGTLIRRAEVSGIDVNPELPLDLFDISSLITTYPEALPEEPKDPIGTDPADEVKRTIEEFQKKFDE